MIKVLMITASAGYGGGPQHVCDLASALRDKVHVSIACPRQEPYYERFRDVIDGDMAAIPERRFTLFAAFRLLAFIRSRDIGLLHSHGKGAGVYGRFLSLLSGLPLVHTPHGIHVDQYGRLLRTIYLSYERLTGWIDARTIFVSPSEMARARSLGIGRQSRCTVVCNGVASPATSMLTDARIRLRQVRGLDEKAVVVVSLSRFNFAKNMEEMVRVADLARNLHFWLLGDGPGFNVVRSQIDEGRMDHVWSPGFVSNPLEYLAAADIYLSTSRWEGLPLAILEAMSLGKPVVASDVTGNSDAVVHGETGYLYSLGQLGDAADCLYKLAREPDTMSGMGDAARDRQRNEFSIAAMAGKTLAVYRNILGG